RALAEPLVLMVAPLAPHIAEELWQRLGHPASLAYEPFPSASPLAAAHETVTLPVQVNGRKRFTIEVPAGAGEADIERILTRHPGFAQHTQDAGISRLVIVPGKIVNVVVRLPTAPSAQLIEEPPGGGDLVAGRPGRAGGRPHRGPHRLRHGQVIHGVAGFLGNPQAGRDIDAEFGQPRGGDIPELIPRRGLPARVLSEPQHDAELRVDDRRRAGEHLRQREAQPRYPVNRDEERPAVTGHGLPAARKPASEQPRGISRGGVGERRMARERGRGRDEHPVVVDPPAVLAVTRDDPRNARVLRVHGVLDPVPGRAREPRAGGPVDGAHPLRDGAGERLEPADPGGAGRGAEERGHIVPFVQRGGEIRAPAAVQQVQQLVAHPAFGRRIVVRGHGPAFVVALASGAARRVPDRLAEDGRRDAARRPGDPPAGAAERRAPVLADRASRRRLEPRRIGRRPERQRRDVRSLGGPPVLDPFAAQQDAELRVDDRLNPVGPGEPRVPGSRPLPRARPRSRRDAHGVPPAHGDRVARFQREAAEQPRRAQQGVERQRRAAEHPDASRGRLEHLPGPLTVAPPAKAVARLQVPAAGRDQHRRTRGLRCLAGFRAEALHGHLGRQAQPRPVRAVEQSDQVRLG
ncbi:MAG: class I tRNA ligase family protein, partial [Streptosporangiaceae bacterium]|nr:class I tRNA ligase family protein [Streptosporangiaceae bacterium]